MVKDLTEKEAKTISYYNEHAEEWSGKHKGGMFDSDIDTLTRYLPEGKVLEIGSGHGRDAQKLIAHYGIRNYTGIDASKGLLKIAQNNNPNATFYNKSIYEIEDLHEKYDGFWICAMLIHIPKNRLEKVLQLVHSTIRENGVGFVSIMEGSFDMEESRPGRHYSLWTTEEFEDELKKANFKVLEKRKIETDASPWLAYFLKVQ